MKIDQQHIYEIKKVNPFVAQRLNGTERYRFRCEDELMIYNVVGKRTLDRNECVADLRPIATPIVLCDEWGWEIDAYIFEYSEPVDIDSEMLHNILVNMFGHNLEDNGVYHLTKSMIQMVNNYLSEGEIGLDINNENLYYHFMEE